MAETLRQDEFRSGDALVAFDSELRVVSWNRAAEKLLGATAEEAIGRYCWDVVGGRDEFGNLVCHVGCRYARLASEGRPVPSRHLIPGTGVGGRMLVSTVVYRGSPDATIVNLFSPIETETSTTIRSTSGPELTPRQLEILRLMGDGVPAKRIASNLHVSVATVRNHIRAVLTSLDAHSQLEAVAAARKHGLI